MRKAIVGAVVVMTGLLLGLVREGRAEPPKPRFVFILDTSSSMIDNPANQDTHGDGTPRHLGCDLDGNAKSDDSKLYQAKGAIQDTITSFGSVEFALGRYKMTQLGQTCTGTGQGTCPANTKCEAMMDLTGDNNKYCVRHQSSYACGGTCTTCDDRIFSVSLLCNGSTNKCVYPTCRGGDVIVPFPSGASNYGPMIAWVDGVEELPVTGSSNRELRSDTGTPLASSIDSVREWLTDPASTVGTGAGAFTNDPNKACRSYAVLAVTDGKEACGGDPVQAACNTYHRCKSGSAWDATAKTCGTCPGGDANEELPRIKVYVIGFAVSSDTTAVNELNSMAAAGGTGSAIFANNRSELTARLGEVISASIPKPKCDCDETCDGPEVASFPLKGSACSVGVGRCKRTGVYACNGPGDGVVCATANTCPSVALTPGTPVAEVCGAAPGCMAPTPEDCQDDNCDGQIDEGLMCSCASKPEICNGLDDNCNGIVDDVESVPCGSPMIGVCMPGMTSCVSDGMGGKMTVCQGSKGPETEICNGLDDNCNGVVDELPPEACYPTGFMGCTFNSTTKKYDCKGACQTGTRACLNGMPAATCTGAVTPVPEIPCNGIDDNCDGTVDETNPGANDKCYPAMTAGCDANGDNCKGECKAGKKLCANGQLLCQGAVTPTPERCDDKDNDCDGAIDNGFDIGTKCDNGVVGACHKEGKKICDALGTGTICTASSTESMPEICNGVDDNCNGEIDEGALPGVGIVCGSSIGECRAGKTVCKMGKVICEGEVGPQPEMCNGLDDNCNGSVDEDLTPPGTECPPPGLPAGAAIKGECRAGKYACARDDQGKWGWQCRGFVAPSKEEVCDGRDNNCDGKIDEMAMCPSGFACKEGECAPNCRLDEESVCPGNRICKDNICVLKPCATVSCPAGTYCNDDGKCIDFCQGITCAEGSTCENGICVDCHSKGCKEGEVCIVHLCEADPCYKKSCETGSFCSNGTCVKDCRTITCKSGQTCRNGACQDDKCTTANCGSTQFCDPADGQCKDSRCSLLQCMPGTRCVETSGKCEVDPCAKVHCREEAGETCDVDVMGAPFCKTDLLPQPTTTTKLVTSGGGLASCTCDLGAPHPKGRSGFGGAWIALLLSLAAVARRRKGR